ncbi:MAG: hypothetical protein KJ621_15570 [Proteobacteria bacterium]|nr:hypothetical protein [Pseudomonadota bacterium]MBU1742461.1 hypothetical protein [Pseudomonadota bacterium]
MDHEPKTETPEAAALDTAKTLIDTLANSGLDRAQRILVLQLALIASRKAPSDHGSRERIRAL